MLKNIIECYPDEEIIKADGLDSAIIGIEINSMRLIYSSNKIIQILIAENKMELEDALEFYEFNIAGAYIGDKTPIYCYNIDLN
jgi:hypothetical protein